jgi:hypothetical protein
VLLYRLSYSGPRVLLVITKVSEERRAFVFKVKQPRI